MNVLQFFKTNASVLLSAVVVSSLVLVPPAVAASKKTTTKPAPTGSIKFIAKVQVPGKKNPLPRGNVFVQLSTTNTKAVCTDPDTKVTKTLTEDKKTAIFSAKTNAKKAAGKNLGTFQINSCTANTKYKVALKLNENKAYQKVSIKPVTFTLKKGNTIKSPKKVNIVIKRVGPATPSAAVAPSAPPPDRPAEGEEGAPSGEQDANTMPPECNVDGPAYDEAACDAIQSIN